MRSRRGRRETEEVALDRGRLDAVIVGLLFMGGMRRSEVATLRWAGPTSTTRPTATLPLFMIEWTTDPDVRRRRPGPGSSAVRGSGGDIREGAGTVNARAQVRVRTRRHGSNR